MEWQDELNKAARAFIRNPTKETKGQYCEILDITEEQLWEEVKKIIKLLPKYNEIWESGKFDQQDLKFILEEIGRINQYLKEAEHEHTKRGLNIMLVWWKQQEAETRYKILQRVIGGKQTSKGTQVR